VITFAAVNICLLEECSFDVVVITAFVTDNQKIGHVPKLNSLESLFQESSNELV
jgi:hypothetical protein